MAQRAPVVGLLPDQRSHLRHLDDSAARATVRTIAIRPLRAHAQPCNETRADSEAYAGEGVTERIPDDVAHQTYVIYRLTRWGLTRRWLTRVGVTNPKPQPARSWWGPCVLNGNIEQTGIESVRDVCPWNLDEARETGVCVNALPGHLSAAVEEEYVKRGTRGEKSKRLGIDDSTMRRRLSLAHVLLLELFNCAAAGLPLECSYRGPGRPSKDE